MLMHSANLISVLQRATSNGIQKLFTIKISSSPNYDHLKNIVILQFKLIIK